MELLEHHIRKHLFFASESYYVHCSMLVKSYRGGGALHGVAGLCTFSILVSEMRTTKDITSNTWSCRTQTERTLSNSSHWLIMHVHHGSAPARKSLCICSGPRMRWCISCCALVRVHATIIRFKKCTCAEKWSWQPFLHQCTWFKGGIHFAITPPKTVPSKGPSGEKLCSDAD